MKDDDFHIKKAYINLAAAICMQAIKDIETGSRYTTDEYYTKKKGGIWINSTLPLRDYLEAKEFIKTQYFKDLCDCVISFNRICNSEIKLRMP